MGIYMLGVMGWVPWELTWGFACWCHGILGVLHVGCHGILGDLHVGCHGMGSLGAHMGICMLGVMGYMGICMLGVIGYVGICILGVMGYMGIYMLGAMDLLVRCHTPVRGCMMYPKEWEAAGP